jgi:hypothetical protein
VATLDSVPGAGAGAADSGGVGCEEHATATSAEARMSGAETK